MRVAIITKICRDTNRESSFPAQGRTSVAELVVRKQVCITVFDSANGSHLNHGF
jgi:hypothetical protein